MFEITNIAKNKLLSLMSEEGFNDNCFVRIGVETGGCSGLSYKLNFNPIFPSKELCGDNAVMIAWTGIQRYKKKLFNINDHKVRSRWPLDKKAPFLKGPGIKLL